MLCVQHGRFSDAFCHNTNCFCTHRTRLGVARGELRPFCVQPEEVPDVEIVELINQCLSFDPKERPTFKEIVKRLNEALERCQKKQRQARSALVMNRKH